MLGITNLSEVPLRLVTAVGSISAMLSLVLGSIYLVYSRLLDSFWLGVAPLVLGLSSSAPCNCCASASFVNMSARFIPSCRIGLWSSKGAHQLSHALVLNTDRLPRANVLLPRAVQISSSGPPNTYLRLSHRSSNRSGRPARLPPGFICSPLAHADATVLTINRLEQFSAVAWRLPDKGQA